MAAGGMYDQIGGGFHRYSVDAKWLVPHFEKMLYDNAQLVVAYLKCQLTVDDFSGVAHETLDYVAREMTHSEVDFTRLPMLTALRPMGMTKKVCFYLDAI